MSVHPAYSRPEAVFTEGLHPYSNTHFRMRPTPRNLGATGAPTARFVYPKRHVKNTAIGRPAPKQHQNSNRNKNFHKVRNPICNTFSDADMTLKTCAPRRPSSVRPTPSASRSWRRSSPFCCRPPRRKPPRAASPSKTARIPATYCRRPPAPGRTRGTSLFK